MRLRGVALKHRIVISPMCTYRAGHDGLAKDWHLVHYGRLALGGAAMVMTEATAIEPRGRRGYSDLGIWSDEHIAPLRRIAEFVKSQGCVAGIQLQHAGRKAGVRRPWDGFLPLDAEDLHLRDERPWQSVAPSPLAPQPGAPLPMELTRYQLRDLRESWIHAARRADAAGFEVLELYAGHGYLLHQFLSPESNLRTDEYGGSLAGRMRFVLEVTEAVRATWPEDKPLLVRISAVDGAASGWSLDDAVTLARELKARGVDLIDCSSGGVASPVGGDRASHGPGFQVPYAERIRREAGIPTMAVGLITTPQLAADIVATGRADLVAVGREALVDPNWPAAARTALEPDEGYAHWASPSGWWLDRWAGAPRRRPS